MHKLIAATLAVAWALAVGASGQKPAASSQVQTSSQAPGGQIPAFRSRITLVPLDVRVVDLDGRPVTGLTRDDFTIVEDSERQTIAYFDAFGLTPEAPGVATRPALRQRAGGPPTPQHGRTFLIVLGRRRIQKPFNGIGAAVQFVRERLLPQDYVAVMAYNRATDFTTDHERIASVLERFAVVPPAGAASTFFAAQLQSALPSSASKSRSRNLTARRPVGRTTGNSRV